MKTITLDKVKRDNTNIRKYDDHLWRVLRKERFKKANPDKFVNEMAAENVAIQMSPGSDFKQDIEKFTSLYLTEREAKVFTLFVFGGKIGQVEIGKILGVCQATIASDLRVALDLFEKWYFAEGEHGYYRKEKTK